MYAVEIELISGRFHATGWSHHVNEGTVEWPPSPLRLQRALVATGFKLGMDEARVSAAVLALRGLPTFRLPPATGGHLRHFMPTDVIPVEKGRVLVFDAFLAFSRGASLGVAWPDAEPEPAERADLDTLWRSLAYLGRAESWVACRAVDEIGRPNACADLPDPAEDVLLEALDPAWLPPAASAARGRKTWHPTDAWDVLCADIGVLQRAGWSRPPGTRDVRYGMSHPAIVAPAPARRITPSPVRRLAVFAIGGAVPPSVERTVSVADRVRRAVMSRTRWRGDDGDRLEAPRSDLDPLIAGKDADGRPLLGNQHAYWLPYASDAGATQLDRLLVAVRHPEGFSPRAVESLRSLHTVWGDEQHDLNLVLLGFDDEANQEAASLLGAARIWVTDTPFIPTRHPRRGRDGIEDQVRRALRDLGHPEPLRVAPLAEAAHGRPWHAFHAVRKGARARARLGGVGVQIAFERPVEGPLSLGWGAHFGMGRFRVAGV